MPQKVITHGIWMLAVFDTNRGAIRYKSEFSIFDITVDYRKLLQKMLFFKKTNLIDGNDDRHIFVINDFLSAKLSFAKLIKPPPNITEFHRFYIPVFHK